MPTFDERLGQVTSKIERAKEHIGDLEREIRSFLDTEPYKVGSKKDVDSGKLLYYITAAKPVLPRISLIAGDIIQNLMSALDHLAFQLVCVDTKDAPPNPDWIYFPIRNDAKEYESKKHGKMEGASDATFAAIDAVKPYKGGNDNLWVLYKLNNIDKHRLLITVGSKLSEVDMSDFVQAVIDGTGFPSEKVFPKGITVKLKTGMADFPLKVGDVILVDHTLGAKPNEKMKFTFGVALSEPNIIEAKSVLDTVHQFETLVENIVTSLSPRLK